MAEHGETDEAAVIRHGPSGEESRVAVLSVPHDFSLLIEDGL